MTPQICHTQTRHPSGGRAAIAPETAGAEARAAAAAQEALPAAGSKRRPPETLARESKGARTESLHLIKAHGRDARGSLLSDCFNEVLCFLPKTTIAALARTDKSTKQAVKEGVLEAKKIVHLRALRYLKKVVESYATEVPEDLAAKEAFLYTLSNEIVRWRESRLESFPQDTSAVFDTGQALLCKAFFLPTDLLQAIVHAPIIDRHIKNALEPIRSFIKLRALERIASNEPESFDLQTQYLTFADTLSESVIFGAKNGELGYSILEYVSPFSSRLFLWERKITKCHALTQNIAPALHLISKEPNLALQLEYISGLLSSTVEHIDTSEVFLAQATSLATRLFDILEALEETLCLSDESEISKIIQHLVIRGRLDEADMLITDKVLESATGLALENYTKTLAENGYVERALQRADEWNIDYFFCVSGLANSKKYDAATALSFEQEHNYGRSWKKRCMSHILEKALQNNSIESAIQLYSDHDFLKKPPFEFADNLHLQEEGDLLEPQPRILNDTSVLDAFANVIEGKELKSAFFSSLLYSPLSPSVFNRICTFFREYTCPPEALLQFAKNIGEHASREEILSFVERYTRGIDVDQRQLLCDAVLKGLISSDKNDVELMYSLTLNLTKGCLKNFISTIPAHKASKAYELLCKLTTRIRVSEFRIEWRKSIARNLFLANSLTNLSELLPELEYNPSIANEIALSFYRPCYTSVRNHLAAIQFTAKYMTKNFEKEDAMYISILQDAMGRKGINIYPLIAAIPEGKRKETLLATIDCVY